MNYERLEQRFKTMADKIWMQHPFRTLPHPPGKVSEKTFGRFLAVNNLNEAVSLYCMPMLNKDGLPDVLKFEIEVTDAVRFYLKNLTGKILAESSRGARNSNINNFSFYCVRTTSRDKVEKCISLDGSPNPMAEVEQAHWVLFDTDDEVLL